MGTGNGGRMTAEMVEAIWWLLVSAVSSTVILVSFFRERTADRATARATSQSLMEQKHDEEENGRN